MRRQLAGIHEHHPQAELPEGIFLVRLDRALYQRRGPKPFFLLRFTILEPAGHRNQTFSARIYCTPKALWKLSWFLRDFGYDTERLERDEIDEKALPGLRGVVKTSLTRLQGQLYLNLDAFAPAGRWEELASEKLEPS